LCTHLAITTATTATIITSTTTTTSTITTITAAAAAAAATTTTSGCCRLEGQILARFEEENGGKLLIATLCLLEVSSRGLLEVELLSILGDEENSLPPTDVTDSEKDDEESAGKSEPRVNQLLIISFLDPEGGSQNATL